METNWNIYTSNNRQYARLVKMTLFDLEAAQRNINCWRIIYVYYTIHDKYQNTLSDKKVVRQTYRYEKETDLLGVHKWP